MFAENRKTACAFGALFLVLLSLSPLAFGQGQSQPSGTDGKTADLPDSEDELRRLLDDTERKIKDREPLLGQWDTVIFSLQRIKDSVSDTNPVDPSVTDQIAQLVKANKLGEAARKASQAVLSINFLARRAGPGFEEGSRADILNFNNKWQEKISAVQQAYPLDEETRNAYLIGEGEKPDPKNYTAAELAKLKAAVERAKDLQKALVSALGELIPEAQKNKGALSTEVDGLYARKSDISAKLGKTKQQINELSIRWGLPMFCGTVLLMLCIPILLQTWKQQGEGSTAIEQLRAIFASGILVEIITVLLLTMTILILGLADKIKSEVLGTLLGGISGYVLNRFRKSQPTTPDSAVGPRPAAPAPEPESMAAD